MKENKKIIYSIFFMFLIYLIAQHSFIYMYFDDFGHASLSYGGSIEGVKGHSFTISQLFEWGEWYYFKWGGRIVYYLLFLLPLLAINIHLFMFIQSLIIFGIVIYMYKICLYFTKKDSSVVSIVSLIILYGLIPIDIMKDTVYWASASVCYIWSFLPLLMTIYYLMIFCDRNYKIRLRNYISILFLSFFAASSFEQSAAAMLIFLIAYPIYCLYNKIPIKVKLSLLAILSAGIGAAIQIFAPGNKIRVEVTDSNFASLSFVEKMFRGIPNVLNLLFYQQTLIFLILLLILVTLGYTRFIKFNQISWLVIIFNSVLIAFLSKIYIQGNEFSLKIKLIIALWLMVILVAYFVINKQEVIIPYLIMLVASIGCLVLSPAILNRSIVYFVFILFVIISVLLENLFQTQANELKQFLIVGIIITGLFSASNTITIFNGYYVNSEINRKNNKILENAVYDSNEVNVYKLPERSYSNVVPYEESHDYSFIEEWMREYYNLGPNTKFNWK
ncbi:DUF6056 family protein [Carnobacterium maltaromaticum]|uniref:DUF6056 family protein n=1 Tax=Carnobacterium maltaromaticum TaxID=2751 RepID=UPI00295EF5D7|nr:DUF6056 family protein [Carnobacterium maltaromaticum]